MTVQSAASRNSYQASGGVTFPYTFLCLDDADLAVYDNGTLVATSAYTVTNVGTAAGGNVVFGSAPTSGHTIIILSAAAYTQDLDLVANDPLPADALESALDRNTILSKQLNEKVGRALRFDPFGCDMDVMIDHPQPGYFLLWNAAGDRVVNAQLVAIPTGITLPTFTAGSIVIATGATAFGEDNANLFWDAANARLGLGTATPVAPLDFRMGCTRLVLLNGAPAGVHALFKPVMEQGGDSWAIAVEVAGIANGAAVGARGAAYFGAQTGGGTGAGTGNRMWGQNILVQQNSADTAAQMIGSELNVNNNKADDPAALTGSTLKFGYSANSDGGYIAGVAFQVSGAALWRRGYRVVASTIAPGGYAFEYLGNGTSGPALILADGSIATDKLVVCDRVRVVQTAATPAIHSVYSQSLAKAWLVFDGNNTSPITPAVSFNIRDAKVTKYATGDFCVSFTTPFSCARYGLTGSVSEDGTNVGAWPAPVLLNTTCCRFRTRDHANNLVSRSAITVVFHGLQ